MMLPVLLTLLTAASSPERPRVFALVIGNNQAVDQSTLSLKFADDDAIAMHDLLIEAGARSVLLVTPDADTRRLRADVSGSLTPTLAAVKVAYDQLRLEIAAANAEGPTEFIFFFSGHGDVSHGEGFLSLANSERLTRLELQALLTASPATRNHVVVDACKASFAVLGKGTGGRREPHPQAFADRQNDVTTRTGFLLSSSSDGDSHEWERYQAGIFSFELRSGLRGSADVDGDGVITYRELGGFLHRANAGIANSKFRPDFLVVPPGGSASGLEFPVLRWTPDSAALTVDGPATHLYVESSSGIRLVEWHRAASVSTRIRLPAERPLFIRDAAEKEERVLQSTDTTSFTTLPSASSSSTRKGALQVAFAQLFSQAFDASALDAFSLDFTVRERPPDSPSIGTRETLRRVSLVTGLSATAVGIGALAVGLERSSISPTTPQRDRIARNEGIAAANVTMAIADGVAVAAFASWLILTLTAPSSDVSIGVSPAGVSVSGRW